MALEGLDLKKIIGFKRGLNVGLSCYGVIK